MSDAVARFAVEVGASEPVAVSGGRTRWDVGGPLPTTTRLVEAPAGVIECRPEDMTVRVLAGTPVGAMEEALAKCGQRSALPSRGGTVGGALAVGENHLDVLSRGTLRASLLQLRYVAHDGSVVSGGAPTVKNVSGFDLPRLMVGALGTLGLLAEVVLRTTPRPEARQWLVSDDSDPFRVAGCVLRRATVLWDSRRTWVHLEGHQVDVTNLRRALPGSWEEVESHPPLPPYRWSLTPSELRRLPVDGPVLRLNSSAPAAAGGWRSVPTPGLQGPAGPGAFVASVGVGTVYASEAQPSRPLDPGARCIAERAKQLFDPTGRLNPGRDPGRR